MPTRAVTIEKFQTSTERSMRHNISWKINPVTSWQLTLIKAVHLQRHNWWRKYQSFYGMKTPFMWGYQMTSCVCQHLSLNVTRKICSRLTQVASATLLKSWSRPPEVTSCKYQHIRPPVSTWTSLTPQAGPWRPWGQPFSLSFDYESLAPSCELTNRKNW